MKNRLLLLFTVFCFSSQAQFGFEYKPDIVVKEGVDTLKLAWTGGLNYAQFSDFDYDFDGDLDLFIFDRSSNNIVVFTQEGSGINKHYQYQQNAQDFFPTDIMYRACMADYNFDGKKDLFCYGVGGIKVYENVGDQINGLQWNLTTNLIYADNWGSNLNLYVSSADIPAIVDVDADNDLDILSFHIGGQHVQYYKNLSQETYGHSDSLNFKLMNECWGKFREDINLNHLTLNDNSSICTDANIPNAESPTFNPNTKPTDDTPKHSGSTLLALDYDGNGVMDLIIGDVSFNNMNLLINGGTNPNENSAMISNDSSFPSNSIPVDLEMFPAAYYLDVDFDGIKDLIVGTNAKNSSENETSVLFYKNTGSNSNPNFIFQTNDFLQNEMIDFGTASRPIICDIDNDGLKDLFVANFFRHQPGSTKQSAIAYYKNTGSTSQAQFTFVDQDFLNLTQYSLGLRLQPTFGDLNNDNKLDLIIGLENGTLAYLENTSTLPSISFSAPVLNFKDNNNVIISAGQYASPQLFDLDKDGLLDLIIGKKTGELMYYKNIGSVTNPSFQLMNNQLGGIDIATDNPEGYPVPHFTRVNDTTHLFIGNIKGTLIYFDSIDNHLNENFHLVSNTYLNIHSGAYSSFFVDDIDNDGDLNLFVGHDLGGIHLYEANSSSQAGINHHDEFNIIIFPNPTENEIHISAKQSMIKNISIKDITGKQIIENEVMSNSTNINLANHSSGIYLIQLVLIDGSEICKKVVKK